MIGWIKSSRLFRSLTGKPRRNVLLDSLISSALMGGLASLSIQFFEADPKSSIIIAVFSAVILNAILISTEENREREEDR